MRHTLAVSHWRKVAEGDDTVVSASIGDAVVRFRGTALAVDADTTLLGGMLRRLKGGFGRGE
jgi:hypothetical protein